VDPKHLSDLTRVADALEQQCPGEAAERERDGKAMLAATPA